MADIFLSYSRGDRARVARLVTLLESQGYSVWWDSRIGGGEQWDTVIERQIDSASCVVVAWSKESVQSRWVRIEANVGQERGALIPVLLDRVDPPLSFRLTQAVDLVDWTGQPESPPAVALIESIGRMTSRPASARRPDRRRWLAFARRNARRWLVGTAALAAVIGVVSYLLPAQAGLARYFAYSLGSDELVLLPGTAERLKADAANLRRFVRASLLTWMERDRRDDIWSFSQMSVALAADSDFPKERMSALIMSALNQDCQCWTMYDNSPHLGVTAWAIRALAEHGQPIPEKVLSGLLDVQSPTGWWPLYYDVAPLPQNASVYATNIAIWALSAALRLPTLSPAVRERATLARNRAIVWLLTMRDPVSGLWIEYPRYQSARPRVALSAAVGAVLGEIENVQEQGELTNQLLSNFSKLPMDPAYFESTSYDLELRNGRARPDNTKNAFYPWAIMMIVNNSKRLTRVSRARADYWIELAGDSNLSDQILLQQAWLASETLIALNRLQSLVPAK